MLHQKAKPAVVTKMTEVKDQIRNHAWKSIKSTLNVCIPFGEGIYMYLAPNCFKCFDPPSSDLFSMPFSRQEISGKDHLKK